MVKITGEGLIRNELIMLLFITVQMIRNRNALNREEITSLYVIEALAV